MSEVGEGGRGVKGVTDGGSFERKVISGRKNFFEFVTPFFTHSCIMLIKMFYLFLLKQNYNTIKKLMIESLKFIIIFFIVFHQRSISYYFDKGLKV